MNKYIDISVTLSPKMPTWTNSYGVNISPLMQIATGDIANVSKLSMDIHSGTHIDAPRHFIDGGKTNCQIPLQKLICLCLVVDLSEVKIINQRILEQIQMPETTDKI